MDPRIPGAFLIRNRKTRKVLHLLNPKDKISYPVVTFDRDEEKYRNEQIWWIDVVPGCSAPTGQDKPTDTYYTISNLAFDYHLDVFAAGSNDGAAVGAFIEQQATGWQMWRFLKPSEDGKLEKMR